MTIVKMEIASDYFNVAATNSYQNNRCI